MVEQATTEVEVDGVEYEVTVDADGETTAEEVIDEPCLVAKADMSSMTFGCKIPLSDVSDDTFVFEETDETGRDIEYEYAIAWDTDVDVSDWDNSGNVRIRGDGLDGHACVDELYISE